MNFKLVPLSLMDKKPIWDMLQEIPKEENGFQNYMNGVPFTEFYNSLLLTVKMTNGIDLKPGLVIQHEYWLYADEQPVGFSKLRVKLTEKLLENGGNIGYGIRPGEREKGYGKKILELTLQKAKNKGLDMVLITCDSNNAASRKIIEYCGGILQDETNNYCKYWIYL